MAKQHEKAKLQKKLTSMSTKFNNYEMPDSITLNKKNNENKKKGDKEGFFALVAKSLLEESDEDYESDQEQNDLANSLFTNNQNLETSDNFSSSIVFKKKNPVEDIGRVLIFWLIGSGGEGRGCR